MKIKTTVSSKDEDKQGRSSIGGKIVIASATCFSYDSLDPAPSVAIRGTNARGWRQSIGKNRAEMCTAQFQHVLTSGIKTRRRGGIDGPILICDI